MAIFKAYDIRGIVPDELDATIAYRIGRGVGRHLGGGRPGAKLAVGRDARVHTPELADALTRGLQDEGVGVVDLGLVATPMLYHAVDHLGLTGGVMVTASHNPGRYNGFKVCREHAIPVGGDSGLKDVERLAAERADAPLARPRGGLEHADVVESYLAQALSVGGACPPMKVAIDCGNGMAAVGLEPLLERLPLDVERLYFEPDGTFPNHEANPLVEENLRDLVAAVRRTGAQLGVAFDGDADRAMFVDERGELVRADLVTALLAQVRLRQSPGATVLYDLRSSRATAEAIREAGGVPGMCRVGHSFIKADMRARDAIFAGELSGHFYFRFSPTLVADDGIAAFVALLDCMAESGKPLSELVAPLLRYSASGEINREVEDPAALIEAIAAEHRDATEVSRLDGLLVRYPDWWFNLRPSNTEPVLRLNLEAADPEAMARRRDALLARIEAG
ncbi:MAG TPA: phosphomannomutase/phosphoglucomutase [Myxococcota bacterium]|nr:phosphomannomutase/phosphoglucomutase [Myxococcota bacterium]